MSTGSPVRPSRRATRKTIIVDESEDELRLIKEDNDEEFTPSPKRSPRKTTRRQTIASVSATPKRSARARKVKTEEGIEPTQMFDPEESLAPSEPTSPTRTPLPRKRKNASDTIDGHHEQGIKQACSAAVSSGSTQGSAPDRNGLDKPMDIVIRARAQAIPQVEGSTEPKSRMVFGQLVMTNFKSYAGRQVVGPFHPSLSAVVGPTGSGKSNVIDSLLFVFGFRASKMRQGKISALIHNSAQHQDLEFCEVEVYFQEIIDLPGGKHDIVPDSQLVVSRKAFTNNTSNYYLNGRTTNFTAVTTLLKGKAIDLDHKRFLILQGTAKYKTPIEEAAVELESLNEVRMEKQGRVRHVEKEKNNPEDKKNKALTFIEDENELAEKQSSLYQIYMAECEDNAAVTEETIQQIQEQLNAELDKHAGSEDAIKELEKAYNKALKHTGVFKELAKYDKENDKFEEKRKFINGKQTKAEKQATSSRLTASEAQSLVEKHTDDIERKSDEVAEWRKGRRKKNENSQ
ncbi:Structural maintenance of chromosomes protein 4 [Exophiala xenobiotica]|nr:Structural maintenance of chromosomes protein 4 [Exophiala xenobiotica]KAK5244108.1 Structural maintenance of chromosomes protein 4 [Exophiala xenobiotica]KAK5259433.1 Structural maintenance of chromosomes protein 4 [Exophiala xenobiotica]KAK5344641.1 Structural maintenance of chromosomes protein 4 [Exophiala xenobiotica]KAK5356255.1 Structural maintenance of chromosomes protein 4 [Exophiala xenobiotica]